MRPAGVHLIIANEHVSMRRICLLIIISLRTAWCYVLLVFNISCASKTFGQWSGAIFLNFISKVFAQFLYFFIAILYGDYRCIVRDHAVFVQCHCSVVLIDNVFAQISTVKVTLICAVKHLTTERHVDSGVSVLLHADRWTCVVTCVVCEDCCLINYVHSHSMTVWKSKLELILHLKINKLMCLNCFLECFHRLDGCGVFWLWWLYVFYLLGDCLVAPVSVCLC